MLGDLDAHIVAMQKCIAGMHRAIDRLETIRLRHGKVLGDNLVASFLVREAEIKAQIADGRSLIAKAIWADRKFDRACKAVIIKRYQD